MKIKEYKNKIVLAELDPKCSYIMLWDKGQITMEDACRIRLPKNVQVILVDDINRAIKFIEIPKK